MVTWYIKLIFSVTNHKANQIQITVRYQLPLVKVVNMKKTNIARASMGCTENQILEWFWWECKPLKNSIEIPEKN